MSFGAWLTPGDTLQSVEVSANFTARMGEPSYFQGQVPFTQSGCVLNSYSFDVCTETGSFAADVYSTTAPIG